MHPGKIYCIFLLKIWISSTVQKGFSHQDPIKAGNENIRNDSIRLNVIESTSDILNMYSFTESFLVMQIVNVTTVSLTERDIQGGRLTSQDCLRYP